MFQVRNRISSLILILLLNACTVGPSYKSAPPPQPNKALVYFMCGDVGYGGGYATKFRINDKVVVGLLDYGYSWLHLDPGVYVFKAGRQRLNLEIEPGKTYYLEYHQENLRMPAGNIRSSSIFKFVDITNFQKQLKHSRYKVAAALSETEDARVIGFKENQSGNMADISFKLDQRESAIFF